MRTNKRRRIGSVVAFLVLSALIGVPCWMTVRDYRQAKASAALIAAIERHDTPATLAALDAGADANAREGQKALSFSQLLRDFWNRARGRQPVAPMPTMKQAALQLATHNRLADMDWVEWEDARLIKALLEHGADVNARDEDGNTALTREAEFGPVETVKALLEHGANVNVRDWYNGRTPLLYAVHEEQVETVKVLLDAGADVNARDENGYTALILVARNGLGSKAQEVIAFVKVLLAHGADVHIKDNDGYTAMHEASASEYDGYEKIVALLKKAGAK